MLYRVQREFSERATGLSLPVRKVAHIKRVAATVAQDIRSFPEDDARQALEDIGRGIYDDMEPARKVPTEAHARLLALGAWFTDNTPLSYRHYQLVCRTVAGVLYGITFGVATGGATYIVAKGIQHFESGSSGYKTDLGGDPEPRWADEELEEFQEASERAYDLAEHRDDIASFEEEWVISEDAPLADRDDAYARSPGVDIPVEEEPRMSDAGRFFDEDDEVF